MISKEELEEMYWGQGKSIAKIAKEIGVSIQTISNWMQKQDIKSRTISESMLTKTCMPSKSELEEMYWLRNMSQLEIAESIGVSRETVCRWMQGHNIKSRTKSAVSLIGTRMPSEDELRQIYWDWEMSQRGIAKEIGVSLQTINAWMQSYGIETRTQSEAISMEKHPNWRGGISFEPYCKRFNNKFKESVRKRDDYTCQLCGHEQLLGGQKLDVHHVHYDKGNCYPDVVTLCRSCNIRVNTNRDYWEQYFEDQLVIRGLCNWSI